MRTALGIDAAWTITEPSGVALIGETASGWRLLSVESSYARFRERAIGRESALQPTGEALDVRALLDSCRTGWGSAPDLVAIDMPLSLEPIVGPRASDRSVSRAFAKFWASAYSPNTTRPGKLSDAMRADFDAAGFTLWTAAERSEPGMVEVYPHTALIALSGDKKRLEYKVGKTTTYWPGRPLVERRRLLGDVWRRIVRLLEKEIAGVECALPSPSAEAVGRELKAYEDRLDAVVCAWVAKAALADEVEAYGDRTSAIFVPKSPTSRRVRADVP